MRTAGFPLALLLAACGGPDPIDLGVALPAARVIADGRLSEQPWRAHVAVGDEGVRVLLSYDPADGGPRERGLEWCAKLPLPAGWEGQERVRGNPEEGRTFRRVATVLHASSGQPWNRTVRRLPNDDSALFPRLFLAAGPDGRSSTVPVFVPPHPPEIVLSRLGQALQPQDLAKGLDGQSVSVVCITREAGGVRYRWGRGYDSESIPPGTGGDVTLTEGQVSAGGDGPLLPDLASFLETRSGGGRPYRVAVVFLETTEDVCVVDVLRVVECGKGDPDLLFFSRSFLHRETSPWKFWWDVRVPRVGRRLQKRAGSTADDVERMMFLRVMVINFGGEVAIAGKTWNAATTEAFLAGADPRCRFALRFDGRCPWPLARPWIRRCQAAGVGLLLRYQSGDRGRKGETELPLARRTEGPAVALSIGDVPDRIDDVGDARVKLTAPDVATVNDVWSGVLALTDAGAKEVWFE